MDLAPSPVSSYSAGRWSLREPWNSFILAGLWVLLYLSALFSSFGVPIIDCFLFCDPNACVVLRSRVIALELKDILMPTLLFILVDSLVARKRPGVTTWSFVYNVFFPLILILLLFELASHSYYLEDSEGNKRFLLNLTLIGITAADLFMTKVNFFLDAVNAQGDDACPPIGVNRLGS